MTNKIKILIANPPEEVNGVTWWRMYQPLRLLMDRYPGEFELVFNPGRLFPSDFIFSDILFAYRPYLPAHVEVIAQAKEHGCKILLDYDDNHLETPFGHPTWKIFKNVAPQLNQCVALADEVWTSTEHLKETYRKANQDFISQVRRANGGAMGMLGIPNFTVIPNAVHPADLPARANGNTKTGVWRGSDIHILDLEYAAGTGQYSQLLRNLDTFQWVGYTPDWGRVEGAKCRIDYQTEWIPTNKWMDYLRHLKPSIVWKPLGNNPFNQSKSNISWLEATCAGAICLTNFAGSAPQWAHCTKELPRLDEYYNVLWQQSRDDIELNYNLIAWNEVRYRQLLNIINDGKAKLPQNGTAKITIATA